MNKNILHLRSGISSKFQLDFAYIVWFESKNDMKTISKVIRDFLKLDFKHVIDKMMHFLTQIYIFIILVSTCFKDTTVTQYLTHQK